MLMAVSDNEPTVALTHFKTVDGAWDGVISPTQIYNLRLKMYNQDCSIWIAICFDCPTCQK